MALPDTDTLIDMVEEALNIPLYKNTWEKEFLENIYKRLMNPISEKQYAILSRIFNGDK